MKTQQHLDKENEKLDDFIKGFLDSYREDAEDAEDDKQQVYTKEQEDLMLYEYYEKYYMMEMIYKNK